MNYYDEINAARFTSLCNEWADEIEKLKDIKYPKVQVSSLYGFCNTETTVKKVIFNPPATVIYWSDNSKTVVKCQNGEPFDPEKGFVMAYLKKLLGNDNTFNKEIAKWVKYDEPKKDRNTQGKKSIDWFGLSSKPQEITFTIKADQITFDELE